MLILKLYLGLVKTIISFFLFFIPFYSFSQKIICGPMLGQNSDSTAVFWLLTKNVDSIVVKSLDVGVSCSVQKDTNMERLFKKPRAYKLFFKHSFSSTLSFSIGLSEKKSFDFSYTLNSKKNDFLFGSCGFIADGIGRLYRPWNTTKIYRSMRNEPVDKMIWMGDNIYLMPFYDLINLKTIYNRYIGIRSNKDLSSFLSSNIKHFSTWDDHDFGPNNFEGDYEKAHLTTSAFHNFWVNFSSEGRVGVSSVINNNDIDFFLTDSRTNRNINEGTYLGEKQLDLLKKELKSSKAIFKIIVSSSQVINPNGNHESYLKFPKERKDLISFIQDENINGVLFFSGDRHHSEIYLENKPDYKYGLYDITCSPLSSPKHHLKFSKHLKTVVDRVDNSLILNKNYGHGKLIIINGKKALQISFKNKNGSVVNRFVITQDMLGY